MSDKQEPDQQFPLRFTFAQRKCIAEILSEFSERLKLDEPNERLVEFSLDEMRAIHEDARRSISQAGSGMKRNSLRHIVCLTEEAIECFQGIGAIPSKERIYQLKITLKDLKPLIWRRIQVRDCTLDKLHYHIQTAMGWTNSHLHHFRINDKFYGDPYLMEEDFGDIIYANSRITRLNAMIPKSGRRFSFEYEYDFGDSWWHEVLYEGCLRADPAASYPLCLEGERACPPEDVGGTSGYRECVKVIANPKHRERNEYLDWTGGWFDPEEFDPEMATKRMKHGLPSWRETA
jgi:pRiA4b ORF-3-like protein